MSSLDLDGLETAIVSMNGSHALTVSDDGSRAIATSGPVLANYDAGTYLDYVDVNGKSLVNISLWKFEKNNDGTYSLSTKVGGATKYLKFDKAYDANNGDDGGGQGLVTDKNDASRITVRVARNGRYCLYVKDNDLYGRYLLQWGDEIKNENRWPNKAPIEGAATGGGACDTFAFCTPVVKPLPNDVYGIACVANAYEDHPKAGNVPNLQQLGNAMLRLEPDGDNIKTAKAFVWKDDDGQIVYFNSTGNNENVSEPEHPTQFYIEKANDNDDQYYIYGYTPGFGLRYLKLYDDNGTPKVTVSEERVTVTVTETTTTKEQVAYNIHNGNVYLRLNRDGNGNIQNFSAVTGVPGDYPDDARFMFVKPTDKTYPQYEHTGTKVGVTQIVNPEINTDNEMKVLIYKTVYDDVAKEYVTYGIDGDGTLVPAYDHGDQVMLYASKENSAWWTVQIGENGYVNFYNEVTGKYLCPQADGGVTVSGEAPGVQLRSKIDRQDKDFVAHNAAIIKWDGDSYYGLEVNNGTLRSGTVTPTEYQEFSFAKVYKETESDDWKHRVETVSDPNITVTMYDFPDVGDSHGHSTHAIAGTIGFVGYTLGATSADLMSSTLTNGWPTSTIRNDETSNTQHSLQDLFTNGTKVSNTMFLKSIHDATGYYEYSAFDNFAHLNGNSFEVYEEIGAPHSESDDFFYNRGNFLPYNNLARDSYSRNVNQFDENGAQINMSDPTLGKELYTLAEETDYYFGMTIDAPFQQPKDGRLYNGEQIVLEFNGDDDMWVYIDDVLVLDIGGDHDAISGSINFTTGEVKVNSTNFNSVYSQYLDDNKLTIQEMFERAGKDTNTGFKAIGTFADYTTHKLRLFYMERGAAASNLHIKFNLQTVTPGALTLKKELDEDMQLDYGPEQKFYFQVFRKGGNDPLGAGDINGAEDAITPLKSATIDDAPVTPEATKVINGQTYQNVFTLRPNEELILTSRNVEEEFYFKEINERDYDVYVNGQSVAKAGYVYQSTDYKADGSKVIYHNANRKAQLEIQKVFDAEKYPSTAVPEFEFQVWLKKADRKYAYYEQGDYGLKNADGKYLQKNGEPQDAYVVYDSASATGKISGIRPGQTIVIPNLLPGTEYMVMEVDEGNLYNKLYTIDDSATPATMISSADEATGTVVGAVTGALPENGTGRVFVGRVQDTNTPNNRVYLRKTDNSDTPNPLTGAQFKLSYLNSEGVFTEIKADLKPVIADGDTEAKVEIGPLTYDTIYRLEETKAPDGYIITENGFLFRLGTDGTIQLLKETTVEDEKHYVEAESGDYSSITVVNGSDSSDEIVLTVKNAPGARLPATGGIGTLPFTIGGLALIIGAALMLILRRKD